jgi:hypothetical protein
MTAVDANLLKSIQENVFSTLLSTLKWMDAASDTYRNYEGTMV